jgi:hypothetical protein
MSPGPPTSENCDKPEKKGTFVVLSFHSDDAIPIVFDRLSTALSFRKDMLAVRPIIRRVAIWECRPDGSSKLIAG